jgi:RND family efflux transporter MFP subunit
MKRVLKMFAGVIVLAVIIAAAIGGPRLFQRSHEPAERQERTDPVKVAVVTIEQGDIAQTLWVTGEVRPLRSVDVTPEVNGRLARLQLPDGTPIEEAVNVRKGDVVAIIDREHFETAVATAEAAVVVANAAVERAKVNLADAQREKERWTRLIEDGAGTQRELDQIVTAFQGAQADLRLAQAQVKQAEASLEQAKVNLEETTIESPFSGVVSRKFVDEGALVGSTTPLFRLIDIHEVEITGGVAGRHYADITAGETPAKVEVDAYPEEEFSGRVSRLRPELDRATRTVAVTIRVPNPDRRLKPGMYARIRLVFKERKNVPIVRDEALVADGSKTRVYVVRDGTIHVRELNLGLEEGTKNEVLEGLRPGERVVIRGQPLLSEGMTVEPVEEDIAQ